MAGAMTPQYIPMFSSLFHIHHKANETGRRKCMDGWGDLQTALPSVQRDMQQLLQ